MTLKIACDWCKANNKDINNPGEEPRCWNCEHKNKWKARKAALKFKKAFSVINTCQHMDRNLDCDYAETGTDTCHYEDYPDCYLEPNDEGPVFPTKPCRFGKPIDCTHSNPENDPFCTPDMCPLLGVD